jgi:hypothetical protein
MPYAHLAQLLHELEHLRGHHLTKRRRRRRRLIISQGNRKTDPADMQAEGRHLAGRGEGAVDVEEGEDARIPPRRSHG